VAVLLACGGGGDSPQPTPTSAPTRAAATATVWATPTTTPSSASTPNAPLISTPHDATATPIASIATATPSAPAPPTAVPPAPEPSPTPDPCPGAIRWDQALSHAGQHATVVGPVVGATFASESRGRPTFLNLGKGYPDPGRFTVLIWIENRASFPTPPEETYLDATICVSGVIEIYQGSAEMEISGPDQIVVVP
jgi:hypothetical protein